MTESVTSLEYGFYVLFSFLFGLCMGSFLNVVIYRLPRKESIAYPASHCPSCGTPINYYDNIPVLGYLFLRGKCRSCSEPISWRYPVVELITGIIVCVLYIKHGFSMPFISDMLLTAILIPTAFIDYEYNIIPNRLTYPGIGIGIFLSFQLGELLRGVHGAVAGFLVLSFMYWLGKLFFKREGMGMGDFKLMVCIGFFQGPFWSVVIMVLAIFLGGVFGGFQAILKMVFGTWEKFKEIPFGPYIVFSVFCVMFFRPQLQFLIEQYIDYLNIESIKILYMKYTNAI